MTKKKKSLKKAEVVKPKVKVKKVAKPVKVKTSSLVDRVIDLENRVTALEGGPEPSARVTLPGEQPPAPATVPAQPVVAPVSSV